MEAVAKEDGIFEVTAAWLRSAEAIDLIFKLTLPDDQDILTGRLEKSERWEFGRRTGAFKRARQLPDPYLSALAR